VPALRDARPCQQLKDDLVGETINRAFLFDANVRTAMEYELRKAAGRRHRLLEVGREVAELAARILVFVSASRSAAGKIAAVADGKGCEGAIGAPDGAAFRNGNS